MPKFKPYDFNQHSMIVINYRDQLQPGTFEHAIHYLVHNKLDLSIFNHLYHNDNNGRPAYDPAILLSIILFAYSKGITSSRYIQWCCETNVIFKALSCDTVPHWTTIASFVSRHPENMTDLFEQVLLVCYQEGLLGNELFAIDGCKMSSNAAKEWSGTFKELTGKRQKIRQQIEYLSARHRDLDEQESDVESELKARLEQHIQTLNNAFDNIDQYLKTNEPRMGQGKRKKEVKSNITDNDSAKMKTSKGTIQGYNGIAAVDKKHQIILDAYAWGQGPEQNTLIPTLERILQRYRRLGMSQDIYEDGTLVTADTGFASEDNMKVLHQQDINAYIPDNQFRSRDERFTQQKTKYGHRPSAAKTPRTKNLIPTTEFQFDAQQKTCLCPEGHSLSYRGQRTQTDNLSFDLFEGKLSQCRHCRRKQDCMVNPESADHRKGHGRQVSFLVGKATSTIHTQWMKERVDSDYGKLIYGHRMSAVEPVFANIGTCKGLKRFSLRSQKKVNGQWQLFTMIHNIEKWYKYGELSL
jgi:transposase